MAVAMAVPSGFSNVAAGAVADGVDAVTVGTSPRGARFTCEDAGDVELDDAGAPSVPLSFFGHPASHNATHKTDT